MNKVTKILIKIFFIFTLLSIFIGFSKSGNSNTHNQEAVILLHGLGRTAASFWEAEHKLNDYGYKVFNVNYPSTTKSIQYIVNIYLKEKLEVLEISKYSKVHFVTHSLGGIITRYLYKYHKKDNFAKVVMLSPPNKGSEMADYFKDKKFALLFLGKALTQLTTDSNSIPNTLGKFKGELGIITGCKSNNPFFSKKIPGPDDGKVSIESAKLDGMDAFLIVEQNHTFIMNSNYVIEQIIYFLNNSKFFMEIK